MGPGKKGYYSLNAVVVAISKEGKVIDLKSCQNIVNDARYGRKKKE